MGSGQSSHVDPRTQGRGLFDDDDDDDNGNDDQWFSNNINKKKQKARRQGLAGDRDSVMSNGNGKSTPLLDLSRYDNDDDVDLDQIQEVDDGLDRPFMGAHQEDVDDDDVLLLGAVGGDSLAYLRAGAVLMSPKAKLKAEKLRFVRGFPMSWERFFQRFDDTLIRFCQARFFRNAFWTYLSVALTALTAIETGIAAPFVFYALGHDGLGTELAYLMFSTALFSQLPKRLIWRYRPYMARRAIRMRKKEPAVTSSFPSRAVTCSVVYSFVLCFGIFFDVTEKEFQIWMPFIVLGSALLSSFARVHLGVHYPSDCLFGFLQGLLVVGVGTLIRHADISGCNTCFETGEKGCYRDERSRAIDSFQRINWVPLVIVAAVGVVLSIVSVVKPLEFWDKCDRVFGMTLPVLGFQVSMLCPKVVERALPHPVSANDLPWPAVLFTILIAVLFVGICTLISWVNNGRMPVISFAVLFVAVYFVLSSWRLYLWTPDSPYIDWVSKW